MINNKFIITQDNRIENIDDSDKLYALFYDVNIENFEQFVVDEEHYNDGINIYEICKKNNKLDSRRQNIGFEVRNNIQNNLLVINLSDTELEISISVDDDHISFWNGIIEDFKDENVNNPIYIQDESSGNRYFVYDIKKDLQNNVIFRTQNEVDSITEGDNIEFYYVVGSTEVEEYILIEREIEEPITVLETHRRTGLSNFDHFKGNKNRGFKTYGEVNDKYEDLSEKGKTLFDENYVYDFSEFSKHVYYGSAVTKVVNLRDKIDKYRKNKKYDSIKDELTPFQKNFLLNFELNESISEQEVDLYIEELHHDAIDYDSKNYNSIIQNVDPFYLEQDKYGYLTSILSMMGEFYDDMWIKSEAILKMYNYSFEETVGVPYQLVPEILENFGFNVDIGFNEKELNEYFDEDGWQSLTKIISKRILFNIVYLYKIKGTKDAVYSLLNIFGIPKDWLEYVEFGNYTNFTENKQIIKLKEYDWQLNIPDVGFITNNISSNDFDQNNHTFELSVRNFTGSGSILLFGNNDLTYTVDNNEVILSFGGNTISFPKNNLWTLISLKKSGSDLVIDVRQRSINGGIMVFSNSIEISGVLFESYETMDVGKNGATFSISEFRVFNDVLSEEETTIHLLNLKSTSEFSENNNLVHRYKSYIAISGNGSSDWEFNNITSNDFEKTEYDNVISSPYLLDEHFETQKIRMVAQSLNGKSLNKDIKQSTPENVEIEDDNRFGVFISPNHLLDKEIMNVLGNKIEFVPDDLKTDTYTFTELEKGKNLYEQLNNTYNNIEIVLNVFNAISGKVEDVIKEFLPSAVEFSFGLFIRNSLLSKNRRYNPKDNIIINEGFRLSSRVNILEQKRIQDSKVKVEFGVQPIVTNKKMSSVGYEGDDRLTQKEDDSQYLVNIENDVEITPWTKKFTIGHQSMYERVSEFSESDIIYVEENRGAVLRVR